MKRNQLQLAKWLVAELEVFAEIDLDLPGMTDSWIGGMLRQGVPFTPSYWVRNENPRQKMRLIRVAKQLERIGLLKRVTDPDRDRTTHVIPSPELISGGTGEVTTSGPHSIPSPWLPSWLLATVPGEE